MMTTGPNDRDRGIWNRIFADVPPEWRTAPPSRAMVDCTAFLRGAGVRTVHDVGCGIGRWSIHLARAGFEVSASDFAERGVAYARRWAGEAGLHLRLRCCAIKDDAFPGESFDAVVAALVLDNVTREEMSEAMLRIRGSLKPSGVSFCLFNPDLSCADEDGESESNPTAGITRVAYTDEELRTVFPGFSVLDVRRYEAGTRGVYLRRAVSRESCR
jgi:SAM-dependent methyltransferase